MLGHVCSKCALKVFLKNESSFITCLGSISNYVHFNCMSFTLKSFDIIQELLQISLCSWCTFHQTHFQKRSESGAFRAPGVQQPWSSKKWIHTSSRSNLLRLTFDLLIRWPAQLVHGTIHTEVVLTKNTDTDLQCVWTVSSHIKQSLRCPAQGHCGRSQRFLSLLSPLYLLQLLFLVFMLLSSVSSSFYFNVWVSQCCLWLVSWSCQTGRESELEHTHTCTHTSARTRTHTHTRPWQ